MDTKLKIGIGVAAVATAGFLLFKGTTLKETADNINIELLGMPKINLSIAKGLTVTLDLKVDNPAKGRVNVKLTSIRAFYKGKQVASTPINDRVYPIEPVSSGKISGIKISASWLNLLTTIPALTQDFLAGANITNNFGFDAIAEVNGIPLRIQKL